MSTLHVSNTALWKEGCTGMDGGGGGMAEVAPRWRGSAVRPQAYTAR